MTTPAVSVVVCTYNRAAMLRVALESLARQEVDRSTTYEVVVVDDGSTDHTARVVDDRIAVAPHALRYVRTPPKARGVACARNLGVATAAAPWIAFFDDDQIAEPDWLAQLLAAQHATRAGCVGGPIVADLPENAPPALGPVCRSLLGEHHYPGAPRLFMGRDLPSTGNLLIARALVEEVGGFDTGKDSGEDTDLLSRVRAHGHDIYTAPGALVHHVIPPHRVSTAYFRWVSRRWGMNFAGADCKAHGRPGMLGRALARGIQLLIMHQPRLAVAWLRRDQATVLDLRCLCWRTEGYLLESIRHFLPRSGWLSRIVEHFRFRSERQAFAAGEELK